MTPDDLRIAEELRKAGKAKQVLENEAFRDAVSKIDQALLAGMRQSGIADERLRLRLLDKYEALHDLLEQLQSAVNTGKFAEEEQKQRTLAERIKKAAADFLN